MVYCTILNAGLTKECQEFYQNINSEYIELYRKTFLEDFNSNIDNLYENNLYMTEQNSKENTQIEIPYSETTYETNN